MALNLSTLTSPATSGDVLAEVLTTADFLEPVPVLRNLARGSNKGGDAEQDVALNQPKALPLIDGDGYLYLSGVSGNYASIPDESALDITGDIDIRVKTTIANLYPTADNEALYNRYSSDIGIVLWRRVNTGKLGIVISGANGSTTFIDANNVTWSEGDTLWFRAVIDVGAGNYDVNLMTSADGSNWTSIHNETVNQTYPVSPSNIQAYLGRGPSGDYLKGAIHNAQVYASVDGTNKVLDIDFTSTNVRHGATKFKCATGQVVTINQSGNDPATVIKKPVLRFDGVNSGFHGLFNQTITDGYFFAAYSVIGNGGEDFARIASLNSTGEADNSNGSALLSERGGEVPATITRSLVAGFPALDHNSTFDDDLADVLFELKIGETNLTSKINNSNLQSSTGTSTLNAEEFNIGASEITADNNAAIDLEFLALFSAESVPDEATATKIRNYINKRNNVFYRWDTDGYYFFDPQKATFTGNFTAANTLDGYITGSDLGDTDVRSNLTLEQSTLNDQPSTDGYTITFNDSAEHLEFVNGASQALAGWQVVGTSLGTFAYKVNANAVTELNLLGNLGNASYRKTGDLYGVILLPESATGADIKEARKLLIDRGAADGVTVTDLSQFWRSRADIVEFHPIDTSSGTDFNAAWRDNNLTSFPLIDTSNGTIFYSAWQGNNLTSFPLIDTSSGTNFFFAWYNNNLTSFPLIDTSSGTNFSYAWMANDLTSFPLLDTSSGTGFSSAWGYNNLTSFPLLDTSSGTNFASAWSFNNLLTDFPAGFFDGWNPSSLANKVFNATWDGCNLTAQSVENILTSIDASGKYATSTGLSGGTALADAGIDIDYNGDPLSAATTAAITSLKSKGWSIFINSVEQ